MSGPQVKKTKMTSSLDQLKSMTTVVADTGDFHGEFKFNHSSFFTSSASFSRFILFSAIVGKRVRGEGYLSTFTATTRMILSGGTYRTSNVHSRFRLYSLSDVAQTTIKVARYFAYHFTEFNSNTFIMRRKTLPCAFALPMFLKPAGSCARISKLWFRRNLSVDPRNSNFANTFLVSSWRCENLLFIYLVFLSSLLVYGARHTLSFISRLVTMVRTTHEIMHIKKPSGLREND